MEIIDYIKDKKIAILGFGREGRSTYNFIRKYLKDKEITIIDKNEQISKNFNDKYVKFVLGNDYLNCLDEYDLIIKTPGISLKDIDVSCLITSQLELTLEYYKDQIIGITGTKGKSTTSSLIYQILKDQGCDVYLLGNIGIPIFDYIDEFNKDTILVIEMSALQLEYVKYSPKYGIILNLFEEHLDYFKDKNSYFKTKLNMFKYQNSNDYCLYYENNQILNSYINDNLLGNKIKISNDIYIDNDYIYFHKKKLYNINDKRYLLGNHNIINIMFSLVISELFKLDIDKTIDTINNFKSLENRLELVGTYDDIIYYNDSIATIPEATIYAIETLMSVDTIIIGGMDRGIEYCEFSKYLASSKISNLICMKDTGYKIGKMIEDIVTNNKIIYVNNLEEAVKIAKNNTEKGKICLLSPAAPSYNEFKNFEEKGKKYKELVKGEIIC